MRTNVIRKAVLTVASILTLTSANVIAKDVELERAQKELRIMSKIFETSISEQSSKTNPIYGSKKAQATYLAKQGMVFTFNFGRNSFTSSEDWEQFGEGIGQFVGVIASEVSNALADIPSPPDAPEAPSFDNYEDQLEAYQERLQALESMREQQREQREEVRELQREIRSLERQSTRERDDKKELEEVKEKLETKLKVLDKKMGDYKESMRIYREKRDQKYTQSTKLKSDTIISTLCDYGSTLRSLSSNEHVTLIFTNYANSKDQIHVFNSTDIKRCDSREKLLRKAISYQL